MSRSRALSTQPPFVRRRRANPIVQALKFVVGVGAGLVVGCLLAALLAPRAGEDTRRKLRELLQGGDGEASPESGGTAASGAASSTRPIAGGAVETIREGVAGLLANPKARFQVALEEARREREVRERELRAEFEVAKRTGNSPT
jgi:gas vesicle protein